MLNQHQNLRNKLTEADLETLQLIRDTSTEVLFKNKDSKGVPFLKHVFDLHLKLFGTSCSGCPGEIPGYIQKIKNFNPEKKMETKDLKFKLHEEVIVPVPGTSDVYSNANLTDEIAVKLIAENPNRKALFAILPDDVEDLIQQYSANEINVNLNAGPDAGEEDFVLIGDNKLTVEEALSLFEKLNIETKATTVKGLNTKFGKLDPAEQSELVLLANDLTASKSTLHNAGPDAGEDKE